ncbi:MAG: ABC transporter permease subunit [Clostridiales bacterium]|nr:ABC transporter permease subunit [Clostridiales bacterium]
METKVAKNFSGPLMKQNIKSNVALIVAITLIMLLMSTVMNYAMSIMGESTSETDVTEYQTEFYTYLGAMAAYDSSSGAKLSYDDFISSEDKSAYETAFSILNAQSGTDLSVSGFQQAADGLSKSDVPVEDYVKQFEYNYVLMQNKGCFTGDDLSVQGIMDIMLETMGMDSQQIEMMTSMDSTAMIDQMYYMVTGLLPLFLLIVFLANSLIVDQVDKGSMAYVLSTPTKRSAVAKTQITFMVTVPFIIIVLVCISRLISTRAFFGEVNVASTIALFGGMYLLVQAVAGICFMGSCIFNRSRSSMAFGGGISVWFFLASLLGMFGSDMMVNMGIGVKQLGYFNKTTLVGLYDINSLATVGTDSVDYSFVWKCAVLAAVAVVCYAVGAVRFKKKDLPL